MVTILLFILCFTLILINWKFSLPIFIIASIYINFDIRCGNLSFINLLALAIIFIGFIKRKHIGSHSTKIDKYVVYFFLYSIIIYIPFIILSTELDYVTQLNHIKDTIIILTGYFIWKCKFTIQDILKYRPILSWSIIIICLYGIFSYITKSNPYMDFFSSYLTHKDIVSTLERSMNDARGSLTGRITGTSLYTIQYAILMAITFYCYWSINFKKNTFNTIALLFVVINIYLTGSRGPLVALLICVLLYLLKNTSITKQLGILFVFILGNYFFTELLDTYIYSFFQSSEIKGSSIEMRMEQLGGAFLMVSDNMQSLLFGNGLGYTSAYITKYGMHPIALYFESTHIAGLVNYGLLGLVFIFIGKLFFLYYIILKAYLFHLIDRNSYYLLVTYLLMYFIYNITVGNVYETYYIVVYFIMLKISYLKSLYPINN